MNIAAWLVSLVGPIVARGMIALGFTAVTFTGVTIAIDALVASAQSNWNTIPLTVLQLASLSGIPEFMGMTFGAIVARAAIWASIGASSYVFKK